MLSSLFTLGISFSLSLCMFVELLTTGVHGYFEVLIISNINLTYSLNRINPVPYAPPTYLPVHVYRDIRVCFSPPC
uniref:Putative secreted protein n=1 Tax=Anopheles marajoara TaxID=58244 RepID=A0A2M4CCR9_9DIPT